MPQNIFKRNLRTIRLLKGWTQVEVAEKLKVDPDTVSKWENGYAFPTLDMLITIADIFETSVDDLCRREAKVSFQKAA